MRSPFQHDVNHFPGGKGLSFRNLINLMPPHRRYIETHLGGGAVLRNKRPADENVGIDIDGRVVDMWSREDRAGVRVVEGCALEVLTRLQPDGNTLIYADPPYLASTRRTSRLYRHELDEDGHRRLLLMLLETPAMVVISGYANRLYDETLSAWHRTSYSAGTHHGVVEEIAWTNFEPGDTLHDYRFVGATFRERERFRRRSGRLADQLSAADDLELNAALAALAERRPAAVSAAARRLR